MTTVRVRHETTYEQLDWLHGKPWRVVSQVLVASEMFYDAETGNLVYYTKESAERVFNRTARKGSQ
jgi:hypothetical protein